MHMSLNAILAFLPALGFATLLQSPAGGRTTDPMPLTPAAPAAPAAKGVPGPSDAQKIANTREAITQAKERIASLQERLDDPDGEYKKAEADFEGLNRKLKDAKQAAAKLALAGKRVAYVSGEEAADQVRLRARRLGLGNAPVQLAAATSVRDILTTVGQGAAPDLLIIDSIQTMHSDLIEGAPGTVSQVRASAGELIRFAKEQGTAVVLVGHVTKDGSIAGPRVLEHMVDTVLAFEGERSHQYRILRAVKNRFGGTDEIGVFAMDTGGLAGSAIHPACS